MCAAQPNSSLTRCLKPSSTPKTWWRKEVTCAKCLIVMRQHDNERGFKPLAVGIRGLTDEAT